MLRHLSNTKALACATWFAKRGIPVFPCTEHGKRPATRHGLKDATTDADTIARWWPVGSDTLAYNLAIPTGIAFDVIDIDRHGQVNGFDTLALDAWSHLLDRPTLAIVATAGAGLHLWIPATGDGNTAAMAPGIDYRGVGGYVIVPPSVAHENEWRFVQTYTATPRLASDTELREIDRVIWS